MTPISTMLKSNMRSRVKRRPAGDPAVPRF
jgi:hypothetical protein